jgi:glycosyltransferase involved in cell wall biosynthesis
MNTRAPHIVIDARIRRSSTGRYTDRLLAHLQNIDHYHRYTVLLQPDDPWKPTAANFHTKPCPFPQFSLNPTDQIRFAKQLHQLKPDLVHFTMTQQPLLYFGRIVTTTHDLTMFEFVRRGKTNPLVYRVKIRLYKFLMWMAHRKSRWIIVPTRTVAKEVADMQPFTAYKIAVTPEATEPPLSVPGVQPVGVSGDFIMYVGTAFPHKNLPKLIESFDILTKTFPKLKLVLVGKKEVHYEELETWARNRPSRENIIFTGFVSDESLKWLYQHCQAYVFPSLSEGWGLPPLEAMSHGAPVVASRASCIPEVLGDAAYYFNAKDEKDIAEKVTDVLKDKKLREKLIAAGEEQVKKYSWEQMAQETLVIYKSSLR